jgi:solute carrier family 8 (sodium/calcium exchanger)
LKVPNCFGKDFDVGQQMEKAKEQTLSMFTKTKAAFSRGVNTVDQALFKDNGGTTAAATDEKLLPAKTELSNGTAKPEETPSSGGGTRGIYVVTLLLLFAALGIVFAMRARSEGGLAHDATAIREFVEATTENLVEDIQNRTGQLQSWAQGLLEELQEEDAAADMCDDGLLVPGPKKTRVNAGIFVFLLLWSFVGVAIAADVFMVAIEYITSSEVSKTVEVNGVKRTFTVQVWNATVANLTLMALGSSAPEILLSVIEIVSSGFFAGELGPSTIVGSAAFNLLVICAVCIVAIPAGESRIIKDTGVFYITATFSVFAYLWLVVILQYSTPNIVDVWEGCLTFAFFPILVYLAYLADTGAFSFNADGCCRVLFCSRKKRNGPALVPGVTLVGVSADVEEAERGGFLAKEVNQLLAQSADTHLTKADREKAMAEAQLALKQAIPPKEKPKSRAYYRVEATRSATGGKIITSEEDEDEKKSKVAPEEGAPPPPEPGLMGKAGRMMKGGGAAAADFMSFTPAKSVVQFAEKGIAVPEDCGAAKVQVVRSGTLMSSVTVKYYTKSGTATAGADFIAVSGDLTFFPGQGKATISVPILDDDEQEDNETFTVVLEPPDKGQVVIGDPSVCEVTIEDNDTAGNLTFDQEFVPIKESVGKVLLTVVRVGGTAGTIGCSFATKEGSARAGTDFAAQEGTLTFPPGVTRKEIAIEIIDDANYEKDETFQVVLSDPTGGANIKEKGVDKTAATIKIINDEERRDLLGLMVSELDLDVDNIKLASSSYVEQITSCLDYEGSGCVGATLYVLSLPFKIIFAFVPPPRMCGGWACFIVALAFIGALTALIGDLATHTGCCLGLLPAVTAITFVAMGTSLPDTFASKQSATSEPYADNSIGNVTGSNSVNVFLGLGMPWAIAAIYWTHFQTPATVEQWRGRYRAGFDWYTESMPVGFAVPAGDLSFSVAVFAICAVICLSCIILRRQCVGMELGGPPCSKYGLAFFFVLLWFTYIGVSSASSYGLLAGLL